MSYMSMTVYNIYSFLFIIVYIVCILLFNYDFYIIKWPFK